MTAHFGLPINYFFISQHRFEVWAPPDWFFIHISKTSLKEFEEDPLSPLVVDRIRGINLSIPIDREANTLNLPAKVINIRLSGDGWMRASFDGVLFGR